MGLTSFTYQNKHIFSLKNGETSLNKLKNTEPKRSFSFVVSDNKTRFKTWRKPPIQLDKKKDNERALMNLETYSSFPNIHRSDNCFTYSHGADTLWVDIIIPEGSYDVEDIIEFIQREMRKNYHYDKANDKNNMEISAYTNTLKSEMFLKNNYEVDFRIDKSINILLGFHSNLYTSGFYESGNIINILSNNSILVNMDNISGSYVNGSTQPTIYSFFVDVSPGYKTIENPHNLLYLPVTADKIHSITIWLTDQNRNELNLRGENLSMRFHLREI